MKISAMTGYLVLLRLATLFDCSNLKRLEDIYR